MRISRLGIRAKGLPPALIGVVTGLLIGDGDVQQSTVEAGTQAEIQADIKADIKADVKEDINEEEADIKADMNSHKHAHKHVHKHAVLKHGHGPVVVPESTVASESIEVGDAVTEVKDVVGKPIFHKAKDGHWAHDEDTSLTAVAEMKGYHKMEDGVWMRDEDMELDEQSHVAMKGFHKMKDGRWMRDVDMDAKTAQKEYHQMEGGRWMRDDEMIALEKEKQHSDEMKKAKKLRAKKTALAHARKRRGQRAKYFKKVIGWHMGSR